MAEPGSVACHPLYRRGGVFGSAAASSLLALLECLFVSISIFPSTGHSSSFVCAASSDLSPYLNEFLVRAQVNSIAIKTDYHELHKIPELAFHEMKTSEYVQRQLKAMGITNVSSGWGRNKHDANKGSFGIVADIGTGKGPCIALRADMDALPIQEETKLPFKSKHPKRMHACGHDGHMAMLLGAAKLLKDREKDIKGTVRLIFQPAEEGGAGAKMMIDEGVLAKEPKVEAVFGLHGAPQLDIGTIGGKAGELMAATDSFVIKITGKGGHGAMPHLAIDPIPPAVSIAQTLNALVSRELSAEDGPGVVSLTRIEGGFTHNVIPSEVELEGTFRSFSMKTIEFIRNRIKEIATSVAKVHRCSATVTFTAEPYIPVVNDDELWRITKNDVDSITNGIKMIHVPQTMGAEDFGFFANQVPGLFLWLGIGQDAMTDGAAEISTRSPLHTNRFVFNEAALPIGAALHANFAMSTLKRLYQRHENHKQEEL